MQILRRPNESFCFSNGRYLYPIVTMSCYFLFCGVTLLFIFGILMITFLSRLPIPPIFRSNLPWCLCILENHMFLDNFCCFLKFFPSLDKAFHLKFLCFLKLFTQSWLNWHAPFLQHWEFFLCRCTHIFSIFRCCYIFIFTCFRYSSRKSGSSSHLNEWQAYIRMRIMGIATTLC